MGGVALNGRGHGWDSLYWDNFLLYPQEPADQPHSSCAGPGGPCSAVLRVLHPLLAPLLHGPQSQALLPLALPPLSPAGLFTAQ